jgi:hypothetical protein
MIGTSGTWLNSVQKLGEDREEIDGKAIGIDWQFVLVGLTRHARARERQLLLLPLQEK